MNIQFYREGIMEQLNKLSTKQYLKLELIQLFKKNNK